MTPVDELILEERDRTQGAAAYDLFLDGQTDAAFGNLPKYRDSIYLQGYCAGIRELPINADGTIRWYAPPEKNAVEFEF